jgi:hypothetical protein
MKLDGRKIVGVVAWDTQIAQIADRAGVDLISVGDSVVESLGPCYGRECRRRSVCCRRCAAAQAALVVAMCPRSGTAGRGRVNAAMRL